jgi:hypothetical protein
MRHTRLSAVVLVAALLLAGGLQAQLRGWRDRLRGSDQGWQVGGLNSFAIGLALGGLRGPLVMVLWIKSENAKAANDLEGVESLIEAIRVLQADFDSVHLFQIWNKAYNLSVQMTAVPNKYAVILDAVEYATRVDAERPNRINILSAMAEVYTVKLGQSSEKGYYIERVREQTRFRQQPAGTQWGALRRQEHESLLTPDGRLRPELLAPRLAPALGDYNGARLQFLEAYDRDGGFPYGISPTALGYNYYRRAAELQRATAQRHIQLSAALVDVQPAHALRSWAAEERERALRLECRLLGRPVGGETEELDRVTAQLEPGTRLEPAPEVLAEVLFGLRRSGQLARDAVGLYRRHALDPRYSERVGGYAAEVEAQQALADLCDADGAFLQLLAADSGAALPADVTRADLAQRARQGYAAARDRLYRMMLTYYTPGEVADLIPQATQRLLGKMLTRWEMAQAPAAVLAELDALILAEVSKDPVMRYNYTGDVGEYRAQVDRAVARLRTLGAPQP